MTWLALLPVVPGLSVLGLLGVRFWRQLSPAGQQAFFLFAALQQLAALLTPTPGLTSVTAVVRSLLILGLLGAGAHLKETRRLWPVLIGGAVVAVTALTTSEYGRLGGLLAARLSHPYLTEVSLGILGALGALLSLVLPASRAVRVAAFLASALLLLFSGSRGPLLMLGTGCLAWLLARAPAARWRTAAVTAGAALVLVLGVLTASKSGAGFLGRLVSFDSTGRDLTWLNAMDVIRHHPVGGLGPYLLGQALADPVAHCTLWPTLAEAGYACPPWLVSLGQPWLIAHNGVLQQLGEGGVVGTVGLFLLLGTAVTAAWRQRDAAATALMAAVLTGSFLDNTFVVPSPFFAELFWIAAGTQLARQPETPGVSAVSSRHHGPAPGLTGMALLLIMGFPIWASLLPGRPPAAALHTLNADLRLVPGTPYRVQTDLSGPDGRYRVALTTCRTYCQTAAVKAVELRGGRASVWLEGQLLGQPQRLNLLLLPAVARPWEVRPLARQTWQVKVLK